MPPTAEAVGYECTVGRGKVRRVIAAVLGVFAVAVLVLGVVGVWAHTTLANRDRVGELAEDVITEPQIQQALAVAVTDLAFDALDVDLRVTSVLPDWLETVGEVAVGEAQSAVTQAVAGALAEPVVQQVVVRLAQEADARLVRVLEGDGLVDGITVEDGSVTINLLPLAGRGLDALQRLGLFGSIQVPPLAADGDPAAQIAALEAAFGIDLPDDFGQFTIYESAAVKEAQAATERAQEAVAVAYRALWLTLAVGALLIVASILTAVDRWGAVLAIAAGAVVGMVVLRGAVDTVVDDAPNLVADPAAQTAISIVTEGLGSDLRQMAGVVLIAAAVVVLAVLVARRFRRTDVVFVVAALLVGVVLVVGGVTWPALLIAVVVGVAVPIAAAKLVP